MSKKKQVMHPTKTQKLEEFLRVTVQMSQKQLKAIDGLIPMTQDVFNSCVEKCVKAGARTQYERLISEYPQLFDAYIDEMGKAERELSARELQSDPVWQGISARIRPKH